DRVGNHRSRRYAVVSLNHRFYAVGGKHLERRLLRGPGQRVRILPHEQWPIDSVHPAMVANCLGDGENVGLGEGRIQRTPAVATGSKADELLRIRHVWPSLVVSALELLQVHQQFPRRWKSSKRGKFRIVRRLIWD